MLSHFISGKRFRQPWGKGLVEIPLQIENSVDILEVVAGVKNRFLGGEIVFPLIAALAQKGPAVFFPQPGKPALVNSPVTEIIEAAAVKQVNLSGYCLPFCISQWPRAVDSSRRDHGKPSLNFPWQKVPQQLLKHRLSIPFEMGCDGCNQVAVKQSNMFFKLVDKAARIMAEVINDPVMKGMVLGLVGLAELEAYLPAFLQFGQIHIGSWAENVSAGHETTWSKGYGRSP